MSSKILLVEDDPLLAEMIEDFLVESGYDVCVCADAGIAFKLAQEEYFDLWIFDIKLPSDIANMSSGRHITDGFSLLRELRARSKNTPAIYTTSLHSIHDMQQGFESGCDDYIKKPFELKELLLRIRHVLKSSFNDSYSDFEDMGNGLKFFYAQKALFMNEQKLSLTTKEIDLLVLFLQNKRRFISYDEIFERLWGYETPSEMSLRVYVKRLRQIIGKDKIRNYRSQGYCYDP